MAQGGRRIGTWVILGLLFVGLIGFGTTGLSGRVTTLATVGDKEITLSDYARELSGQIDAFSAQTGQRLPVSEALRLGIDRFALSQIVASRAMDNEASRIGLSVGDAAVAQEVTAVPAFQSAAGFSREAYAFALEREGLSEAEFETRIREDISRTILQGAVVGGVSGPDTYAQTLSRFIGEERDIRYILLSRDNLDRPVPAPSPEALAAFHAENADRFTAPEVRKIDYAWLTPDMIQDRVEIDETALRDLYDQRIGDFNQPERRLVERLVLPDDTAADDAMAQIAVGALTFDTLVTERGLRLTDVDLGDVVEADLGDAGPEVFAADVGAVVGPLPSEFGPALFRVNAVLDAVEITFEEATPDLREELAAARARREIDNARESINDLMAGGAGIADLASNTDMQAGQIDWSVEVSEGIAAYASFREAAGTAEAGGFPELMELEDGGLFALTVTEVVPPAVRPFENVIEEVSEAWLMTAEAAEVSALAERTISLILQAGDFTENMPEPVTETGLTRRGFLGDTPSGLVEEVFGVGEGELAMAEEDGRIAIAMIDTIRAPDPDDADLAARAEILGDQAASAIAQELLNTFMTAVQERTDISIDQSAVNAVHTQLQ